MVGISEAEVADRDHETGLRIRRITEGVETVLFYNVLWIEREDEIAYRKGVGAVRKEAWDSLSAATVTFKLG
jgi:hypothetical protein